LIFSPKIPYDLVAGAKRGEPKKFDFSLLVDPGRIELPPAQLAPLDIRWT